MTNSPSISPPSSITSCSRDSEDVTSKYQRLAAQYAQLRAQVVVLKRGLLDERERNTFIKNNDVGKAQKIRSLEQEVRSHQRKLTAARLKKGTAQWLALANSVRIFINLSQLELVRYYGICDITLLLYLFWWPYKFSVCSDSVCRFEFSPLFTEIIFLTIE